jgi:hypothetical protein
VTKGTVNKKKKKIRTEAKVAKSKKANVFNKKINKLEA